MPSAILVKDASSSDTQADAIPAISAYLTPLLAKHARDQPLIYEDLLASYEAASTVAASVGSMAAQKGVEHLHQSQLAAYEMYAKAKLVELAQVQSYPSVEPGESMPAYIGRLVTTIRDGNNQFFKGWRISDGVVEEAFWSKVKLGARKLYFASKTKSMKGGSEEDVDKKGETGQKTINVKGFEAAALSALVAKSQPKGLDTASSGEDVDGGEPEENNNDNDMADDGDDNEDDGGDDSGDDEEAEAEDDDEDDGGVEEQDGDAEANPEDNAGDMPPVKTPVNTEKRRRLPNGPLGGGSSAADGGKKQQPAKKLKSGKGLNGDSNTSASRGNAGGRGKGDSKGGKAGRGGGGGRGGNRKRNRKKGSGVTGAGIA